jgi:hypothetical protein
MKKIVLSLLAVFLVVAIVLLAIAYRHGRDRFPGYQVALSVKAPTKPVLRVGFAAVKITPTIGDTWTDKNGDAQFNEADGDTYQDTNGNGQFDAVWMAGFQNRRPAQGIHDDLWARAVVIDDGQTRLALVSLDVIGFGNDQVIRVRQQIPAAAGVSYTMVSSTHVHEGPDMLGLWGSSEYQTGVNAEYMTFVQKQAAQAVVQAAGNLRLAKLKFAQDDSSSANMLNDTRPPVVRDTPLRIMQAVDVQTDSTLGSLVVWGCHPEVVWDENLQITSDFPHYLRQALEKDLGGTSVFVSGAIGGLMTITPDQGVEDPFSEKIIYTKPSFEKARAVGETLALIGLEALRQADFAPAAGIDLQAKTIELALDNPLYRLGVALGVLDAGYVRWGFFRTEVSAVQLGEAVLMGIPGELYPEIAYGGIESPKGQDFAISALETPPLMAMTKAKYVFLLGLTNDEIGYIVPKSQWDEAEPFTYQYTHQPYGEINSCGPETAPTIHAAFKEIMGKLGR